MAIGAGLFCLERPLGAATIATGDVTLALGPAFFVDEAAIGGSDVTITQPASGNYARSFSGLLIPNQGLTRLTFTGFGFATFNNAPGNTATSLSVSITYLGADGTEGGGDDALIGAATGDYVFTANGEYVFAFDTPLTATLNITGVRFLIRVTPANAGSNGKVSFKTGSLAYEGTTGPKFSVAGLAHAPRVNLARYQPTTSSTTNGQYLPTYATDGVVGNDNSWRTLNVNNPHWAEVVFPFPVTVRSAHIYSGINGGQALGSFKVQYRSAANWLDAPGSSVTGNASVERNVLFSSSVTADRFRLYFDDNGNQRVKEFALFPPNPNPTNGVEQGFPLGTDVELNLAKKRPAVATATAGANYPKLAVDGLVNDLSRWQTTLIGSNALEIDLRVTNQIGSMHLYSGAIGVPVLTDFTLRCWTSGGDWVDIPGGSVSSNTNANRLVTFTTEPTTSKVLLVFTNGGVSAVRELCIFPANGGAAYSPGQDVTGSTPPSDNWETYNDAFYQLRNRAANLPASAISNAPSLGGDGFDARLSQYQVLLNVGTDTYRLRNRATGRCLVGAGLSTNAGAWLVEQDYAAMPHHNWRLLNCDGTDFRLINDWSGLAMDTEGGDTSAGTRLTQTALHGGASQRWRALFQGRFPRKGVAGFLHSAASYQANWGYNWGRTTSVAVESNFIFNPMQWGNFNWDIGATAVPLEQYRSEWQREDQAMCLLGFNEPDGDDQSNITVSKAIELWPRLERMGVPLVSPATKNPLNSWMTNFMSEAASRGHRLDAVATHKYPGPNGGDPSALITELQMVNSNWGRPIWLTEFSTVDWAGTGNWTEEDNYNWLAEFLWRAESLAWLRRYSLFLFTADTNYPAPINPWDPVAPRSNAFQTNGAPTSFGELYFAWDGDASVRGDKAYFLHNKGERKRLRNSVGESAPSHGTIREGTSTTQWVLRPAPATGQWYLTSLRDGRRLRYSDSVVDFAAAGTTGAAVTWTLVEDQHGWFYFENLAAPSANRRLRDNAGVFSMVSAASTGNQIKWRFVPPFTAAPTAPPAPVNLNATGASNQVSLTWSAGGPSGIEYWLYRGTNAGGSYSLLASNLAGLSYQDSTATPGVAYYYVATARDITGGESPYSTEASATPPLPTTPANLAFTVGNDAMILNWPASYLGWLLQAQTNTLALGLGSNWFTIAGSETSNCFFAPIIPANPAVFYRLKRP